MEQESKFPQLLSFIFLLGAMMVTPLLGQIAARGPAPEAPLQFVLQISTGNSKTIIGGFKSMSGMDSETEVIEYSEGGDNQVVRKLPGRTKYPNIVLKRGVIDRAQNGLWNWRNNIIEGVADKRDGAVILMRRDGSEVVRYEFFGAFPVAWKGFSLQDDGSIAVETIELAVERIERVQ